MDKSVIVIALGCFVVPIAFGLAMHSEELMGISPDPSSPGKLLYFYSPS